MFFKSKKSSMKCENCHSKIEKKHSYCPSCGQPLKDVSHNEEDLGLLGSSDSLSGNPLAGLGISDKLIGSIMNNLMKNLDSQFNNLDQNTEIQNLPNGIKIRIGPKPAKKATKQQGKKEITDSQIKKMAGLPRTTAKTNLRRLSNKVIYELTTPGVQSVQDIFVSKLESGYEVKAIGNKKVYINSLPVTLPLKKYSIADKRILLEFESQ